MLCCCQGLLTLSTWLLQVHFLVVSAEAQLQRFVDIFVAEVQTRLGELSGVVGAWFCDTVIKGAPAVSYFRRIGTPTSLKLCTDESAFKHRSRPQTSASSHRSLVTAASCAWTRSSPSARTGGGACRVLTTVHWNGNHKNLQCVPCAVKSLLQRISVSS
jgi:hypothetical protein